MRIQKLWLGSLLLWLGACAHDSGPLPTQEGVRTKGGDSATLRVPAMIARGEYAEAEALITEFLKAGLLSGAKAEQLRQRLREAQEQRAGPGRDPHPVGPSWHDPDDSPRNDEPTCGRIMPRHPLCQELPDEYTFPSARTALEAMRRRLGQKDLKLHGQDDAQRGPCPDTGSHYNVRLNGERMGSITCCRCCVDMANGPIEWEKCRIVW